jgi:hypothetical protein
MTTEITAEEVARRFPSDDEAFQGLERISGPELHALLAGGQIRHRRGYLHTSQEFFSPGGVRTVHSGYGRLRQRYVIVSDALCVEGPRGWRCRRLYRDRGGAIFQVVDGVGRRPDPIEVLPNPATDTGA